MHYQVLCTHMLLLIGYTCVIDLSHLLNLHCICGSTPTLVSYQLGECHLHSFQEASNNEE